MVQQCLPLTDNIYIIDNASTYQPLLDWYKNDVPQIKFVNKFTDKSVEIEIIYHPENEGHTVWLKYLDRFPEEYVLTDPDLLFNPEMPNNTISILSDIGKRLNYDAVGLALDISDHDCMDATYGGQSVYNYEKQFWENKIQSEQEEIYIANIDTTFGLHFKSATITGTRGCVRVAGRFTCKHIPWYRKDKSPLPVSDEENSAFMQNNKSTNWRVR